MKLRFVPALLWLSLAASGCATLFGGYQTTAIIRTSASELLLFDSTNSPLSVVSSIVDSSLQYSFTLDKRKEYHDIRYITPSRSGFLRIRRDVNHVWWLPNLVSYGLGGVIDLATEAIYYYPPVRLALDSVGQEPPKISRRSVHMESRRKRYMLSAYGAFLHPTAPQALLMFPAGGAALGVQPVPHTYMTVGYEVSGFLYQYLDGLQYELFNKAIGLSALWYPVNFGYVTTSIAFNDAHFGRGDHSPVEQAEFDRGFFTGGVGLGLHLGNIAYIDHRWYFGLSPTPLVEGRTHSVSYSQLRIGISIRFDALGEEL